MLIRIFEDPDQELYYIYGSTYKFKDIFSADFSKNVGFNRDGLNELINLVENLQKYDCIEEFLDAAQAFKTRRGDKSLINKES